MTEEAISKTDFAVMCKVDPSRVSHWIRDGKISGPAIVGSGRSARIVPSVAREQLKLRLDTSQRLGNGLGTCLDGPRPPIAARPSAPPSLPEGVWTLIGDLPQLAAYHVADYGGTIDLAYLAYRGMAIDLAAAVHQSLGTAVDPETFPAPDFKALAKAHGADFDLSARRRALEARLYA